MKNTGTSSMDLGNNFKTNLEKIFEEANETFLQKNYMLFEMKIAERTLCGALMIELHEHLKNTEFCDYYVDVEYNRNKGNIKTIKKTYRGPQDQIITINCDLIVHSRGEKTAHDNLIAIEMKKSNAGKKQKELDKERLECLTKKPEYVELSNDEDKLLPEHVCGYELGIYYEVNFRRKEILIEYYNEGELYKKYIISIVLLCQ